MKKVLIIGGTGGLGSQVAELMKVKGDEFDVVAVGSSYCDIRVAQQCEQIMEIHKPDVLIDFAGINNDGFLHKENKMNVLIDTNIKGTMNLVSTVLPGMRARGYGRIVLISSVLVTNRVLGTGIYTSCKAFIDQLVKQISDENIGKGITANSLRLGYFDGGLTYKLPNPETFKEKIPLKRWGRIDELVSAIEFLINTEYCTGVNLPLTGGL